MPRIGKKEDEITKKVADVSEKSEKAKKVIETEKGIASSLVYFFSITI